MKKIGFMLCMLLLALGRPARAVGIEEELLEADTWERADAMDFDIGEKLENLTLEEKIAQLFLITPEALTGTEPVTAADDAARQCFDAYPVGGLICFSRNIQNRVQLTDMLREMQDISRERLGLPLFLAVDEEGGSVTRVYGSGVDSIPNVGDMLNVGLSGDTELAYQAGNQIGSYLAELNFNVDFAPVADIFSNPENEIIGNRAFGYDAATAAPMVESAVQGFLDAGVEPTLKHFPGHGDTKEDSHAGCAWSYKTLEELREEEFLPFRAGIEKGADFVMVAHISLPNVLGDDTPCTLSSVVMRDLLRDELGFQGLVITDALDMGAITDNYSSGDAAVKAFLAGADILLMPYDFHEAYDAVLAAANDGTIPRERIDESVERILQVKHRIAAR